MFWRPALVARFATMTVCAEAAKRAPPVSIALGPLPCVGVAGCGIATFVAVAASLLELVLEAVVFTPRLAELGCGVVTPRAPMTMVGIPATTAPRTRRAPPSAPPAPPLPTVGITRPTTSAHRH